MAREIARIAQSAEEVVGSPSPFILWEGGRDSSPDGARTSDVERSGEGLAMALEPPSLFNPRAEPAAVVGDARSISLEGVADSLGATAASAVPTAVPEPASLDASRTPRVADPKSPWVRRALDWRLVGLSLLLLASMALGAIAIRGVALGAAYAGLNWEDHRVVAGETIGSILEGRDLPGVGLGRLVDWVEERNGLVDATIVPGQILSVPR